ncbi:hypothetical protein EHV15_33435 [Paenibacillus oralis]|uniref:Uncharacterized protein n=1 Tax=Paenibacillus oralis TaxID=2490856 RepID=A0A3P3UC83_9BACL|nr:hypothetical protein EHV15_33435 [Paenibacillus oralis]
MGAFIFLLGCFLLGRIRLRFLMRELRISLPIQVIQPKLGSVLVGIVFAAGWTPCIGPILLSEKETSVLTDKICLINSSIQI